MTVKTILLSSYSFAYVIDRWPYGGDMLTPSEIGEKMRLNDRQMPTDDRIRNHYLPDELMYPKSRHMFKFPYSTRSDIGKVSIAIGATVLSEDRRRHREQEEKNNFNRRFQKR